MTHFTNEQFPPKSRLIPKPKEKKKKKTKQKKRESSPQKEEKKKPKKQSPLKARAKTSHSPLRSPPKHITIENQFNNIIKVKMQK